MGVKNRRISFHMHSLSSAELKHNYPQTLFSSPMLLLPHATPPLFDFPWNFRGILLPIPNKKPAGKLWQLLVSANRTECYQHTAADPPNISIFAKMDRYIFTSCKKKTKVLSWFDNVMLITWCVCRKLAGHHRGNRGDGRLPALHEDSPRVQLHCEGNTHTQVTLLGNFVLKSNLLPGEVSVIKE